MARAIFEDALKEGTYNWDTVVYKTFSLVLLASLGSREGDVKLSSGYTDCEYLRFEHTKVEIFDCDGIETVGIHVELCYDKGHK